MQVIAYVRNKTVTPACILSPTYLDIVVVVSFMSQSSEIVFMGIGEKSELTWLIICGLTFDVGLN